MRVYDKEFKEEAIKLSGEVGPTVAAEKLGIPVTTLYTWRSNANRYGNMAIVGSGHKRVDPKTAEIRALEKQLKELEATNDILKRALAFFAMSQKK
ncbi:transposase [Candidatus Contubernalis alkaliaceticus]|uniref:transposase n=1 Tax=Candidatus Contubernalis alkaliaceticus TaxID=338645 RepID=UPI001F4C0794|nr:transposase [Candidatus Contubernalis alkalaceticus]UNC90748.1 transposase [Candidatus Contubernalis alkalaceticus]UNC91276.1 transposase [Candidatus Contubernalis alkalaceticus]UNC91731.1 transposase [Candidatus Contubernalis alkalaceticus]UNC92075.1 transposase [Candidatus Contubernalis alkalaceticus]UNC92127.1 transposase [Candidatus Contubernalis alkalaceticus]